MLRYPAIDKLGTEITKSLYKLFFSRVNNVFFVVESIKGFVAVHIKVPIIVGLVIVYILSDLYKK